MGAWTGSSGSYFALRNADRGAASDQLLACVLQGDEKTRTLMPNWD